MHGTLIKVVYFTDENLLKNNFGINEGRSRLEAVRQFQTNLTKIHLSYLGQVRRGVKAAHVADLAVALGAQVVVWRLGWFPDV